MNELYLPGMEPVNPSKMINGPKHKWIDLKQFDKIILCVSGGKDSHAMLFYVAEMARDQGVSDRLHCLYSDTGMEWDNTEDHVAMLSKSVNVPLATVESKKTLLEYMEDRVKRVGNGFPSMKCRYCTSRTKADPMAMWTKAQNDGFILQITGERKLESKSRSQLIDFCFLPDKSTKYRSVFGWRPMLEYTEADIWVMIKKSGAKRHFAYDAGADCLGCACCVFSSHNDLRVEAKYNPKIAEKQIQLETDSGYRIRLGGKTVKEIIK
ncbi:MAG: phosphoadenosine phosphosulfate reductase family protein [Victivallaceae bacterium]|nr:phosphoadenosine phosphosulfate reductase family protein [Victivallaceae bacterium]